jgi:hypothetical protein
MRHVLRGGAEPLGRRRDSFKKGVAAVPIVLGVLVVFGAWFVLVVGSYLFLTYR